MITKFYVLNEAETDAYKWYDQDVIYYYAHHKMCLENLGGPGAWAHSYSISMHLPLMHDTMIP